GAGKSTLLRLVAGLLAPSRGEVNWQGASTRGQCALSAPDAPLYRELTCLENLRFFAQNARDEAILRAHLQKFDLESRADDLAGDLSSGLRARLQLAVAAWFEAPILLLDEPSANLDESGRELVQNLIAAQRSRGITLLATNDARDLSWCDGQIDIAY
ncbi:MAG TPA: ATP-binding cassette domain-containing protein, partial [Abditibacterium sp.]